MRGFSATSTKPVVTGCSNTRSECQALSVQLKPTQNGIKLSEHLEASVDYLVVASTHATHADLQEMVEFVAGYLGDEFFLEFDNVFSPGKGCKKYQNSGSSVRGCRIGWNVDSDGNSKTWFSIPGQALRQVSARDVWRLCQGLRTRWGVKCRRFDSALDDYLRRVKPREVQRACEACDVALVGTYQIASKADIGEVAVPTVYLGSRESEKFIRFYDAERKHGTPCDRWELEMKRRHAEEAFRHFTDLPFDPEDEDSFEQIVSQFLAGLVVGAVDFVKFEADVRYSRRKRLTWWASLVDEVGAGIRLSPARPKPSLERSLKWFTRQVAVVVSALKDGWGTARFNAWLADEMYDAKQRYSAYHEAVIRTLKGEAAEELA